MRRHLIILCLATLGSWAVLVQAASAGSVSLRVQREGERTRVTVSGAYTQFPSRLLVWVHAGTSPCLPTNRAERLRVEAQRAQGEAEAGSVLTLTLGTSGATAGSFDSGPRFTRIRPPARVCAYLLPPQGVTRDPDDPPEATAGKPIPAPPKGCRLNPSPGRKMLLNRLPRRRGSPQHFIAGDSVVAQLDPPPGGCSVEWTVSGADQVPPTAVKDYNKPASSQTPAPPPVLVAPGSHVLGTPVRPEPLGNDLFGDFLAFYLTAAPDRELTVTATIRRTRGRGRRVVVARDDLTVQAPLLVTDPDESTTDVCPLGVRTAPLPGLTVVPVYVLGLNPSPECPGNPNNPDSPGAPGIKLVIRVRPPTGGRGAISLNQLITRKEVTQQDAGGTTVQCSTHYRATPDDPVADGSAEGVYPRAPRGAGPNDQWTLTAQDSPSLALAPLPPAEDPAPYGRDGGMPPGSTRTYFQEFEDRVMYRPPGGIWVSIGWMRWSFRGSVTQTDRDGIFRPVANPAPEPRFSGWSRPGGSSAAGRLPSWSQFSSPVKALVSCPAPG